MSGKTYTPAEICEIFGIAKTTLFRWEQEDWFPKVGRDLTGQREYTQKHIQAISSKQLEKLYKEYEQALKTEDVERLRDLQEAISLSKFLQGNKTGLWELSELAASRRPSRTVIDKLLRALEQYNPGEPTFSDILEVALEQSRALQVG